MKRKEKKKSKLKIIIPIAVAIIVIVVIGIFIVNMKSDKLTTEEQYAVTYLLCNRAIKPNTVEISRVWVCQEGDKWYFAYDITSPNAMFGASEIIYGNEEGITLKELEKLELHSFAYATSYDKAPAKVNGKQVNAERVYKAFQEQY